MRKGLNWAIPLLLAAQSLGQAQQGEWQPVPPTELPAALQTAPAQAAPASPAPATAPGARFGSPMAFGQLPAAGGVVPPASPLADPSRPSVVIARDLGNAGAPPSPLAFWANAEYLMWWVKGAPVSNGPTVTLSNSFTDRPPGALGQPGTAVLFGQSPIGYGYFSGLKVSGGVDLGSGLFVNGSYFALERRSSAFTASSNARGNPLLGIATYNTAIGLEDALLTSNPDVAVGPWSGNAIVQSHLRLQGYEFNTGLSAWNGGALTVKGLLGFRAVRLDEDLTLNDVFTPLTPGVLTFLGAPVPANTVLTDYDRFSTTNRFYGGQLGGQLNWQRGAFLLDLTGKVALGATQQGVSIAGASTSTPPGGVTAVAPGGIYAQVSNIGNYSRSVFSVVPEAGATLGWRILPNVTCTLGYTFLYWTGVARPGDQVDRAVNQTLIPTHQFFGLTPSDGRPAFVVHNTDFWAQGINFGVIVTY